MLKEILFVQSVDGFMKWSVNGVSDMVSYLRRLGCQCGHFYVTAVTYA